MSPYSTLLPSIASQVRWPQLGAVDRYDHTLAILYQLIVYLDIALLLMPTSKLRTSTIDFSRFFSYICSMKFQLVLAALVGLVAGASFYPPISSVDQQSLKSPSSSAAMSIQQTEFNDILSRQRRFLSVDNVTVVNATTMAVTSFYIGSIALGVLSVLNDAALSVAKHKRARRKKLRAKQDNRLQFADADDIDMAGSNDDITDDDITAESEYARYEQEVREYQKKYQEYLDNYKEWAEEYGQDPTPPGSAGLSGLISKRYLATYYIFQSPSSATLPNYVGQRCTVLAHY